MSQNVRFRAFREHLRLKRKELAALLGRTYQTIKDIEDGKSSISIDHIKKISENYGLNPNWLITGQGEMLTNSVGPESAGVYISGKRELSRTMEELAAALSPEHRHLLVKLKEEIFQLMEEKDELTAKHTRLLEEIAELYKRI